MTILEKMKPAGCIILMVAVLLSSVSWLCWASISGWFEIKSGIRAIERFDLSDEINSQRSFGVNTYTNELSSQTIKGYYNKGASTLVRKDKSAKTFSWEDQMGYPRVSTVVQASTGFIEVRASINNDNDSVSISFRPGHFDKPDAKALVDHKLPNGLLR